MNQLTLFGKARQTRQDRSGGHVAYQRGSRTSREAAERVDAATLRERVFRHIAYREAWGMTDEECQDALAMNPSTQRPRRVELVRAGRVVDSGRTRPTRSGRQAVVWIAR